MSKLKTKEKEIAVPGEILATGMDFLPSYGTYREGDAIRAGKLGIVQIDGKVIKLVQIKGRYLPKRGDTIIGKVTDILMSGWRLSTNSAYSAVMPLKDASNEYIERGSNLARIFNFDDVIMCKITNVTSQKLIDVSAKGPGLRRLRGGMIITVSPYKVPRIIGKAGSMVSMVKQATGSQILVGQNGVVWINNDDPKMEVLTIKVIKQIEAEGHFSGLTDKIKKVLEKETGKKLDGEKKNDVQEKA